jgi:uncharacterized protein
MIWAAFILGLSGSIHCVGMCGPLLLSLPFARDTQLRMMADLVVYHSGRILTYTALGLILGLAGQGLAIAGGQKALSIVVGCLMIGMAIGSWQLEYWMSKVPGFATFTNTLKMAIGRGLSQRMAGSLFMLGMLNGLLPCGIVYMALAGAISTANAPTGAAFMLLFGLGTLPLLFMVVWAGRSAKTMLRGRMRLIQHILLALAGILLIQRGLNLDLSLFESTVPPAQVDCH